MLCEQETNIVSDIIKKDSSFRMRTKNEKTVLHYKHATIIP